MQTSVVSVNGRVVVPAELRRKFRLRKGTKVVFLEQNGKLILQPLNKDYFLSMAGILGTGGDILKSLMEDKKKERGR